MFTLGKLNPEAIDLPKVGDAKGRVLLGIEAGWTGVRKPEAWRASLFRDDTCISHALAKLGFDLLKTSLWLTDVRRISSSLVSVHTASAHHDY